MWKLIKSLFNCLKLWLSGITGADIDITKLDTIISATTNELENSLNSKYSLARVLYGSRPLPKVSKRIKLDVRNFITPYDSMVEKIVHDNNLDMLDDDIKVMRCFSWVRNNITYIPDKVAQGLAEYWQYPYETLYYRHGDCEDFSILLYTLLLTSGVPYYLIRLSYGDVDDGKGNKGNHVFLTYYLEDKERWVLMDATYYPNDLFPVARPDYKDEGYYKGTTFSWNEKYCFIK